MGNLVSPAGRISCQLRFGILVRATFFEVNGRKESDHCAASSEIKLGRLQGVQTSEFVLKESKLAQGHGRANTFMTVLRLRHILLWSVLQASVVAFRVPLLPRRERSSHHVTLMAKKKKKARKPSATVPRLVVFDLDGCLWKPELYEIQTSPLDSQGSPFQVNRKDDVPGTTLKSAGGVHTMELLGETRAILHDLFYNERWYPTYVGISSRTHPPEWAEEILSKVSIYGDDPENNLQPPFSMADVFTPELCILDRGMDKATQFELLLDRANTLQSRAGPKLQFKDMMFFDNEAGNCKQVSRLGVTCVYTPKGLTMQAWENGLSEFPYSRGVLGPKLPY